jgi:hypothetical protein
MSKKNVPAYLAFIVDVLTRAEALELSVERDMNNVSTLPENKGFCFVYVDGGTAALIVPKSVGELKACDLHIEWEGEAGHIEPVTDRGAVVCSVDPSEIDLDHLLTRLSGAKKRDRKAASKKATKATLDEMKAKLAQLGIPKASPAVIVRKADASQAPADEDMIEGELSEQAAS